MAIVKRNVIFHGKDRNGSLTEDFPITSLSNIEDTADTKSAPKDADYIPVIDSADHSQMKKTLWSSIKNALAGMFAALNHTHTKANITDFPTSLPANGGNADTVDSKHASSFLGSGSYQYIGYNGYDANNYTVDTHIFLINARNAPSEHGFLDVYKFSGAGFVPSTPDKGGVILQVWHNWKDSALFVRVRIQNAWGDWQKFVTNIDISGMVSHPNLLYNWYFFNPINQRGKTEFTGKGYFIDGWKENYIAASKMKLTNKGIVLENGSGTNSQGLLQFIENYRDLAGKTVTFSALITELTGNGIRFHIGFRSADNSYGVANTVMDMKETGLFSCTGTFPPAEQLSTSAPSFVRFYALGDATSATITAVKLELGDHQTLAHQDTSGNWVLNDPPPNPATELIKCQRYFQVIRQYIPCAFHDEKIGCLFAGNCITEMRTTPNVILSEFNTTTPLVITPNPYLALTGWKMGTKNVGTSNSSFLVNVTNDDITKYSTDLWYYGTIHPIYLSAEL